MKFLILFLLLISCSNSDKLKATKFAKDLCSCRKGLGVIEFEDYVFTAYCQDGYVRISNYNAEYHGKVCNETK
jgi:hypothetical protein